MSIHTVTPRELAEIALAHPEAPAHLGDHSGYVKYGDSLFVARIEEAA